MIDLHMHSCMSDGTDPIPELLRKVREAGITVFSVTDHDTMEGALEMERLVKEQCPTDVTFICGIEFSSITEEGKCHILGYGCDPDSDFYTGMNFHDDMLRGISAGDAKTGGALRGHINNAYPGGTANNLMTGLGLFPEAVNFRDTPILAKIVGGIAICWQNFGYNIIFITAGLHSISADVYEAAEVDGANAWQRTTKITMPLLRPIMLYIMITSIIGGLQIFDIPKMLFNGSNNNYATRTMVLYMYESAFQNWQFGYGAAAAYTIALIIGAFSLLTIVYNATRGREKEAH